MIQNSTLRKEDCLDEKNLDFFYEKNEKYNYNTESTKSFINSFFPSIPSMAWDRMVKSISEISNYKKHVPMQADIVVTGKCHCNCWHCFRSKYVNKDEMTLENIKKCITSLYNLGTSTIGITGGEPMLRKDIYEIIKLIPKGMEGQLYTTGHNIDENFAAKLKDTNLTRCIISLDNYKEDVVCKLRNNKNAFVDALTAIKALVKYNIYTAVTVCVTEELLVDDELYKYIKFVTNLGARN